MDAKRKTVRIDAQTLRDLVTAFDRYRAENSAYDIMIATSTCIASLSQFAHFHGDVVFEATVPEPDQCETCLWRESEWRDGGWCYMWKMRQDHCHSHKPKDGGK